MRSAEVVIGSVLLALVAARLARGARLGSRFSAGLAGPFSRASVILSSVALLLITMQGVRVAHHASISDIVLLPAAVVTAASLNEVRRGYIPWWIGAAATCLVGSIALDLILAPPLGGLYYSHAGVAHMTDPHRLGSVELVLLFGATMISVPVVLGVVFATTQGVRLAAQLYVAGATLNSFVGVSDYEVHTRIGQAFTGGTFGTLTPGGPSLRAAGLTTQPNILALVAVTALPIAASLLLHSKRRAPYFAALALLLLAIAVSGSRAGVVVVSIGLAVLLLHPRGRVKLGAGVLAVGAVLAFIILSSGLTTGMPVALSRLAGSGNTAAGVSQSDAFRSIFYSNGLSEFFAHPFGGVGFEALRGAQSVYLQLLSAGGVLAFVSFIVFAFGVLALGLQLARCPALPIESQHLAMALTGSTAAWLAFCTVQPTLNDRFYYVPAGLLFGLRASLEWRGLRGRSGPSAIAEEPAAVESYG